MTEYKNNALLFKECCSCSHRKMENVTSDLLMLTNVIGHISEYKIHLDTIEILGKYEHTPWGMHDKILRIIRNIHSH